MAWKLEYVVMPQNIRTAERDLNDDPAVINYYSSGNKIYFDYSDGTSVALVTTVDVRQSQGYLVGLESYGPNGEMLTRATGFRHFVNENPSSWEAAFVKIYATDEERYLTSGNDIYVFDPAGDAITDFQVLQELGRSGSLLFIDGSGGIDTFADTHWGSENIHLQKDANGGYSINFLPLGTSLQLRNFEYIDLADKPSMTLDEYHTAWNAVPNTPAEWTSLNFTVGPYFEGDQITAVLQATDPDGVGVITHSWYREKDGVTEFTGATGTQYTVSSADIGYELRVKATYTDNAGNPEDSPLWGYYDTPYVVQERLVNIPAVSQFVNGSSNLNEMAFSDRAIGDVVLSWQDDRLIVDAGDETDSLWSIERLHFSDQSVAVDTEGRDSAGAGYRLYKAAFDRTPDDTGMGYWISVLDAGTSLNDIANAFIISDEFTLLYGADPNTESFVTALYKNVLDRVPDAGGLNYWQGLIDGGTLSRAEVLANFSESDENIANTDPLIELGVVYQPYGDIPLA